MLRSVGHSGASECSTLGQLVVGYHRMGEVGLGEVSISEIGTLQISADYAGTDQIDIPQVGSNYVGSANPTAPLRTTWAQQVRF
jgi:hypothetical protein